MTGRIFLRNCARIWIFLLIFIIHLTTLVMKKILVVLAVLGLAMTGCKTDNSSLPDNLAELFDPDFARVMEECEYIADADNIALEDIENITELMVGGEPGIPGPITSLKGIEFFRSLEILDCSENQLTTLDLSRNKALTELYCHYNQLTSLNVSGNEALAYLGCVSNKLTSLDVSRNAALIDLRCYDNSLTVLDVSNNRALERLDCSDNQLTTLDLSGSTALTGLNCVGNRLVSLDISQNRALTSMVCYLNPGDGALFPVYAWFDNGAIPVGFSDGSWDYEGSTVTVDYRIK